MSTGAVIFAQNNKNVDYVKLAIYCAERIKQYLEIPVSIITDSTNWLLDSYPNHPFDQIISVNYYELSQNKRFYDSTLSSKVLEWKNFSRCQVYNLTPYDNTLVVDSDFIINSSILKKAFNRESNFQIYKQGFDLAGWRSTLEFERINQFSIPFYWATVIFFRKSELVESVFNLVSYIKDNWEYFRVLYNIDTALYRNDYAFSIAIHIMNGKTNGQFVSELPGKMTYILDRDILVEHKNESMCFLVEKQDYLGEYIAVKTTGIDVHAMNKFSLLRLIDGGTGV
jgi:hypothetical protein